MHTALHTWLVYTCIHSALYIHTARSNLAKARWV